MDYLTIVTGDREPKLCVWLVKCYLSGDVCDDRAVPGQFFRSLGHFGERSQVDPDVDDAFA